MARSRNKSCANQLAERIGHIAKQHLKRVVISLLKHLAGKVDIFQLVLWKILDLDNASSPSASAVCAIELSQPTHAIVSANCSRHGVIFRHAGFGQLLAQLQHSAHNAAVGGVQDFRYGLFGEINDAGIVLFLLQPGQQLISAVRIFQPSQLHGLF